ncbi:MAG: CoA transferase [Firmicutes bacterium]|nr:CoA transferase [Bacillota bacterium]
MRALEGIRVLDLGQIYNGPYCAMLLGYLGAEVIKVEPPSGESTRSRVKGKEAYPFMMLNGNKKDICINLKSDIGKKIFLDLVRKADVVVENYAVGVMDRLGLSYEVLSQANPRIIVASGKGFGSWGPNKDFLAMDLTVQAMTAVMSVTGFEDQPPVKAGFFRFWGDPLNGGVRRPISA